MPDAPRERPSDADLPVDLRQFAPGSVRPDFVARTLRGIEGDADVRFSRALAAHRVPAPSRDFVARTLAAITQAERIPEPTPATQRARIRHIATLTFAAAALVLAALVWWLDRSDLAPSDAPGRAGPAANLANALGELSRPTADDPAQGFLRTLDPVAVDGFELLANYVLANHRR
jgi:hypothetical protein